MKIRTYIKTENPTLWQGMCQIKSELLQFKKTLKDHKSIPREDLGFIVTHDSFDSPIE